MDLWRKFGDMGLLGITVEDSYGGSNMGYLAHAVVMEEDQPGLCLGRTVLRRHVESVPEPVAQEWQ